VSDLASCGTGWKRAVDCAFSNAFKRWAEDGKTGEPDANFLKEWIPYYLAQQWDYTFPSGSIWK
jgi:hypothetical protein